MTFGREDNIEEWLDDILGWLDDTLGWLDDLLNDLSGAGQTVPLLTDGITKNGGQ